MERSPVSKFMEDLKKLLRQVDGRQVVLDEDLAGLLYIAPSRVRATIVRSLPRIPEGEVFHLPTVGPRRWILTELGALVVISQIRNSQAAAIGVEIIRELTRKQQEGEDSVS